MCVASFPGYPTPECENGSRHDTGTGEPGNKAKMCMCVCVCSCVCVYVQTHTWGLPKCSLITLKLNVFVCVQGYIYIGIY